MIKVDKIFHNGKVYTVNENFDTAEAIVVSEGKIVEVGTYEDIIGKYDADEVIDMDGKFVYPGFIDAHCHFYGYGAGLSKADLTGTVSFDEVLERVKKHQENFSSEWIEGRGWDQNDWEIKEFPDKKILDSLFPDNPVILTRVDGHAAIVNSEALKRAGIDKETSVEGGDFIKDEKGELTGVLVDNAIDLVKAKIPKPGKEEIASILKRAQSNCFEVGLTTVDDAGLDKDVIAVIREGYRDEWLKIRLYVMISGNNDNLSLIKNGPVVTDNLSLRSIKIYSDGALGSRGAFLLENYSDKPEGKGFLLNDNAYFNYWASMAKEYGMQLNSHAIGDGANREILDLYSNYLDEGNDLRWRVEHAQVVSPSDISKFSQFNIIPSVQPTHATSDMYWAGDRLGSNRVKHAYAYKDLLDAAGIVALGSDFPVEDINPLFGFYAAVARKDQKGEPEGGFQVENALSREEALRGMTIWAAFSNFEEGEKGSLEKGKHADFVILEKDIMRIPAKEIYSVKVLSTYLGGEGVFLRE